MNETVQGKVLMVAYHFPPMAAAGTHRVMNFSRELENMGWEITVLSCSDFKRNSTDPGLMTRLGPETRIIRAPCTDLVEQLARFRSYLKPAQNGKHTEAPGQGGDNGKVSTPSKGMLDYFTRLLKTPDSMLSFIPGVILKALPRMLANRPDVIYSTAPPYSCHLAALFLKRLFAVPWVADFRDPWADNPFRKNIPYPSLLNLNNKLESWVVKEADLVVANTPALERAFRSRYPHLDKFVTITNGFDPALLERFQNLEPSPAVLPGKEIRLVHTGEVYGLRSPYSLVSALGDLRRELGTGEASFKVEFFGRLHEEKKLLDQARSLGVEEAFCCHGQVGHEDALKRLAEADVLLLLGVMGKQPEVQVPSKLFEYLVFKKPILSLSKEGGAIDDILKQSNIPYLLADLEDASAIKQALGRGMRGDWDGGENWEGLNRFGFDALSRCLSKRLSCLKRGSAPS